MMLGLDIGGTKIELRALMENGEEKYRKRVMTPKTYDAFVDAVCSIVAEAEEVLSETGSLGIGVPGAICPTTGKMKNANCLFLNGEDLKGDLEQRLNRQIFIANDANCFALSEAVDGAGQGAPVVFGAILGTGCGGGVVVNSHLITGAHAIGGEWGHNPLPSYDYQRDGQDVACYCGRNHCIESFISGTGFAAQYRHRFHDPLTAPEIFERLEQGDASANIAYRHLIDQMARSFAAIINVIDPDVIVLGGGMSNVERLYADLPSQVAKYVFTGDLKTRFSKARFGDSSGVRGAAWLPVTQGTLNQPKIGG